MHVGLSINVDSVRDMYVKTEAARSNKHKWPAEIYSKLHLHSRIGILQLTFLLRCQCALGPRSSEEFKLYGYLKSKK